jgi:hypothetical protein
MPLRESVRSGRKENFCIIDNALIDDYAREMQPADQCVYYALVRFMNCRTRSTFVGTAKIAEKLNMSQRTVQRSIKALENLKLIRIVQTPTARSYYVVPVPPRTKTAPTPLFDYLPEEEFARDTDVADATQQSWVAPHVSPSASPVSRTTTVASPGGDIRDGAYKEEQDFFNNTKEQDFFNNIEINTIKSAKTLIKALKLSDASMAAAIAAIEEKREGKIYSSDGSDPDTPFSGTVNEIATLALQQRRHKDAVSSEEFLDRFLAKPSAKQVLKSLGLPETPNMISTVELAIKAEAAFSKLSIEESAASITRAAVDDSARGVTFDKFYFENARWRSNARINKAEQRKLDNLAANARAKEILRRQFH